MKHYAIRPENKLIGISASPQLLRQLAVFSVFGPCLAAYYPQGLKVYFCNDDNFCSYGAIALCGRIYLYGCG